MLQEIFFYKLGSYDKKKNLDKKIEGLNKDGWAIKSVAFNDVTSEYMVLAEKSSPSPLFFTLPSDTTEQELEQMRVKIKEQYEHGDLQNHKPFILSGDVKITKIDNNTDQTIEITREMMDSWFGVDNLNDV